MTINKTNSITSSSVKIYQREEKQAKAQVAHEPLKELHTPKQQELVHITENGRQLQQQDGDINLQRVAELKQKIAAGTLHIESGKIADKLISQNFADIPKK